jgi:hypothetical protein
MPEIRIREWKAKRKTKKKQKERKPSIFLICSIIESAHHMT